jgi:hypothetical protein
MPERMPSIHDVDLIRIQQEKLAQSIQRVAERVIAQGQYQEGQNGISQGGKQAEEYTQEELSWDDGRNMGGYGGPDAKKRRGVCFSRADYKYRTDIKSASRTTWTLP